MKAQPLSHAHYRPRGGTPLFDATGSLIQRAALEEDLRAANGLPKEDIVFVSITDGAENQSREYTLAAIRRSIAECEERGWTFVFLSASIDAYNQAGIMGVRAGSRQVFEHSGEGTRKAMNSLSGEMCSYREKNRMGLQAEKDDFSTRKDHPNSSSR